MENSMSTEKSILTKHGEEIEIEKFKYRDVDKNHIKLTIEHLDGYFIECVLNEDELDDLYNKAKKVLKED